MNDKEKEAINRLKKGESITSVALETGLSAYWLTLVMNREKI